MFPGAGCSVGQRCGEQMPSCNTIRGMKLEQEQEFLGTELRPSGGDRTRPSLARLSPLHCPLRLPTTAGQADCIEMSEPPSRPPELQPLNMLSRANLFPCFLMELQRSSTGCVLEAALGGEVLCGSPIFCCKTSGLCSMCNSTVPLPRLQL